MTSINKNPQVIRDLIELATYIAEDNLDASEIEETLQQLLVQIFAMFNLSRDIQSLSSFKRNTSDFIEQMKQTRQPIVLTVNGKAEIVVQDAAAYQKLLDKIEYLETITGIKEGLKDVEAGQTYSLEEFKQEMQQKHGISSSDR